MAEGGALPAKHAQLELLLQRTELYASFISSKLDVDDTEAPRPATEGAAGEKRVNTDESGSPPKKTSPDRKVETAVGKPSVPGVPVQPSLVQGSMRDYQLLGLRWMVSLYENGLNGILADEMGLGKTLQVISLFAYLWERGVQGPFLIIVPLSTIANWGAEFKKWAPALPVKLLLGPKETRQSIHSSYKPLASSNGTAWPAVITTYELAMKDKRFLRKHAWKFLVIDEGHRIKNLNCRLVKELKQLSTANRLLLTGTPLQNSLQELWSLLNFLLPNIFNDWDAFEDWFGMDVAEQAGAEAVLEEEQKSQLVTKLHRILRPFLLRRVKADVAIDIPPRYDHVVWTPMTALQLRYYKALLDGTIKNIVSNKRCHRTGSVNQLMVLRQCCMHPYLLEWPDDESGQAVGDERLVEASVKMQVLDRILQRCKERGDKAVVFSQMTSMLDILEDYMALRDISYCRLDGSTPAEERAERIAMFADPLANVRVFLISTRAGGLGINLTSANHVIFYDSDFNPQVDKQAHDRCHRIGQTKPVFVYRLITKNSVESEIRKRTEAKSVLEQVVIQTGNFGSRIQQILDVPTLARLLQGSADSEDDAAHDNDEVLSDNDIFHAEQRPTILSRMPSC